MRVRKKPWAEKELDLNSYVIKNPEENKGKWKEAFGNDKPLFVELGCGKGKFIAETALKFPEINFIGLEKQKTVLATAVRHIEEEIPNLFFVNFDAVSLEELFSEGEIDRLYINFCDPWPRKKWAKRRLTYRGFLENYKKLFGKEGELFFKTDNRDLFEFSLVEFEENGWELKNVTFDLYSEEHSWNIATEYEEKFASEGVPICRLEAFYKNKD